MISVVFIEPANIEYDDVGATAYGLQHTKNLKTAYLRG
jgi:hypothetical protein